MHQSAQCSVRTMPTATGRSRTHTGADNLLRDQRGISTAEYAVLFIVIAIGALATWKSLANRVSTQVTDGTTTLNAVLQAHIDANKDKSDQDPRGSAPFGTSNKTDNGHAAPTVAQNKDDGRARGAAPASGTVTQGLPAGSTGVGKQPARGDSQAPSQQTNVTSGSLKDFQDREAARLYNAGVTKDGQHVAKDDQTKQDATGPRKTGSRRDELDKEDQRRTSENDSANKPRSAVAVKSDDPRSGVSKGGERHQ